MPPEGRGKSAEAAHPCVGGLGEGHLPAAGTGGQGHEVRVSWRHPGDLLRACLRNRRPRCCWDTGPAHRWHTCSHIWPLRDPGPVLRPLGHMWQTLFPPFAEKGSDTKCELTGVLRAIGHLHTGCSYLGALVVLQEAPGARCQSPIWGLGQDTWEAAECPGAEGRELLHAPWRPGQWQAPSEHRCFLERFHHRGRAALPCAVLG